MGKSIIAAGAMIAAAILISNFREYTSGGNGLLWQTNNLTGDVALCSARTGGGRMAIVCLSSGDTVPLWAR